ncbi:Peptidase-M43 domain-containing protein [Acanthopleuribacter pedis]
MFQILLLVCTVFHPPAESRVIENPMQAPHGLGFAIDQRETDLCIIRERPVEEAYLRDLQQQALLWKRNRGLKKNQTVTFDVAWHNILGFATQERAETLVDLLNDALVDSGIRFELVSFDYVWRSEWFQLDLWTAEEMDMKETLRVGTSTTLNVYSCVPSYQGTRVAGSSAFPDDYGDDPVRDGIVLDVAFSPVGGEGGATFIHEVGHWLGLRHTFGPSCATDNDLVDDTETHLKPDLSNPPPAGTCPTSQFCPLGRTGPVENFMNYGFAGCQTLFTAGQIGRTEDQVAMYRPAPLTAAEMNGPEVLHAGRPAVWSVDVETGYGPYTYSWHVAQGFGITPIGSNAREITDTVRCTLRDCERYEELVTIACTITDSEGQQITVEHQVLVWN